MIGIDTNVLVRYALKDDVGEPEQTKAATQLFSQFTTSNQGFISEIVLVEAWWVLTRAYHLSGKQVVAFIDELIVSAEIYVQNVAEIRQAIAAAYQGADFADALIFAIGKSHGCRKTFTFDQKAAKRTGMELLTS